MPTPDSTTPYRQLAPEVGAALYGIGWFWPVQTWASYGRAEPQAIQEIVFIVSRN